MVSFPKTIFTYWHQGFDRAPAIVQACCKRLVSVNVGWNVVFLDSSNIGDWIKPPAIDAGKFSQLRLPHRSDVLRTRLLIEHGGVWVDPTVWICKPLDNWLPQLMNAGVFLFHRPGRDRIIANWFIAAQPGNALLQRQYQALCAYWNDNEFDNFDKPPGKASKFLDRLINRNLELPRLWLRKPIIRVFRTYPYMIYHYMMCDLVRSDPELGALFEQMPKVSADIPHSLANKGLLRPLDEEAKQWIDNGQAPLFKLTWKLPTDNLATGSVLDYLISNGSSTASTCA